MCGSLPAQGSGDTGDTIRFNLEYKNSSIRILCDKDLQEETKERLETLYAELDRYIQKEPFFLSSYEPVNPGKNSPDIAVIMALASGKAGVGPMASVAGAFAELLGKYMLDKGAKEVIVENGGDIFLRLRKERLIGIYSGQSEFSNKIALIIRPETTPLGICTSSGSVGHSLSLGEADSVTVVAESCPLADASATAIANEVKGPDGIKKGILTAKSIEGIRGVLVVKGKDMGTWGNLPEIVRA